MVYKSLHGLAPDYLWSKFEISLMFHCREQTIIRIALVIVAPPFGTVFLVT